MCLSTYLCLFIDLPTYMLSYLYLPIFLSIMVGELSVYPPFYLSIYLPVTIYSI